MTGWTLDIPDLNGEQPVPNPTYPKEEDAPIEKILHISDPHVQRDYTVRT